MVAVGRSFFALALIAFGIQQFLFGDFVAGRAPAWPAAVPGRLLWAVSSALVFIAAGSTILAASWDRSYSAWARRFALACGVMIFAWAFLRQLPIALADPSFGGDWTRLGKALTFFGGCVAVAGSLPRLANGPADPLAPGGTSTRGFLFLGRLCLGIFMIDSGIQHFLFVDFVKSLVPVWIPGSVFWTYFAGVALVAGGAGLIFPPTARLAAMLSGAMVFTWFLILHIPRALAVPELQQRNEWIAVVEALAVSGLAFVLTASAHVPAPAAEPSIAGQPA